MAYLIIGQTRLAFAPLETCFEAMFGLGHWTGVDVAQPAAPLPGHPHRLPTGLGQPRGIKHQHPSGLSQVGLDLADQLLSQGCIGPLIPADAALQGQAGRANTIRNRFDVFAFDI